MALTPLRWLAIAVASCALVFIALTASEVRFRRTYNPYREAGTDTTYSRLIKTNRTEALRREALVSQYRYRQLFDSIDAVVARDPSSGLPIRAYYDAALPALTRSELKSLFDRAAGQQKDPPRVAVDVYFVFDTLHMIRGILHGAFYGTRVSYRLPTTPGERCTVLARMNRFPAAQSEIQRVYRSQAAADQLLGPCAFYRSFGVPGRGVGRWLVGGGWLAAFESSWKRVPPPLDPRWPTIKYFAGPSPAFAFLPGSALGCIAGDTEKCATDLVDLGAGNPILSSATTSLTPSTDLGTGRLAIIRFGPRSPQMMAAIERDLGPARFRTFWQSDEDLRAAFEQAAGKPLGTWISGWMAAQYGRIERGPHADPVGIVAGLLLAALSMGGALWVSERKAMA